MDPRGGAKHKLLKDNKAVILSYLENHTVKETMDYWKITRSETLDNLLKDDTPKTEFTFVDRLDMRIDSINAGVSECRSDIKTLQQDFAQFQNVVVSQVTQRFVQLMVNNLLLEANRLSQPTTVTQQAVIDMKTDLKKVIGKIQ